MQTRVARCSDAKFGGVLNHKNKPEQSTWVPQIL